MNDTTPCPYPELPANWRDRDVVIDDHAPAKKRPTLDALTSLRQAYRGAEAALESLSDCAEPLDPDAVAAMSLLRTALDRVKAAGVARKSGRPSLDWDAAKIRNASMNPAFEQSPLTDEDVYLDPLEHTVEDTSGRRVSCSWGTPAVGGEPLSHDGVWTTLLSTRVGKGRWFKNEHGRWTLEKMIEPRVIVQRHQQYKAMKAFEAERRELDRLDAHFDDDPESDGFDQRPFYVNLERLRGLKRERDRIHERAMRTVRAGRAGAALLERAMAKIPKTVELRKRSLDRDQSRLMRTDYRQAFGILSTLLVQVSPKRAESYAAETRLALDTRKRNRARLAAGLSKARTAHSNALNQRALGVAVDVDFSAAGDDLFGVGLQRRA